MIWPICSPARASAMLCGRNSTLAVAQWCRDHQDLLEKRFGPRRFSRPDACLYRKVLPRLDAAQVEAAIGEWMRATLLAQPDEPIALDGKTVRGARRGEEKAPHLLCVCTHCSQETLFQIRVAEKTNESPVAVALFPFLPVAGRVYTADALHTPPPFFQRVRALQGHTLLMVKGNQPPLQEHLITYFADPLASSELGCTIDLQRGRQEVRSLKVTSALNEYLQQDWPGVAQVAQLTGTLTVNTTAETTTEVVSLITTLSPEQASPERLLELVRRHWQIENRLTWLRPGALSALTRSVPALGFSIHKPPSSPRFPCKEASPSHLTIHSGFSLQETRSIQSRWFPFACWLPGGPLFLSLFPHLSRLTENSQALSIGGSQRRIFRPLPRLASFGSPYPDVMVATK